MKQEIKTKEFYKNLEKQEQIKFNMEEIKRIEKDIKHMKYLKDMLEHENLNLKISKDLILV